MIVYIEFVCINLLNLGFVFDLYLFSWNFLIIFYYSNIGVINNRYCFKFGFFIGE